jgi:hypothetical protein
MSQKRYKEYATIQIQKSIKLPLVSYCDDKGLKISRFVELLIASALSGSLHHIS